MDPGWKTAWTAQGKTGKHHYSRLPYPAEERVRQQNRIILFITANFFQFALEGKCRPCARAGNHNLSTSVLSFEDGNITFLTANDYTSRNRAWTLPSNAVNLLHFSIKLFTNRFLNERKKMFWRKKFGRVHDIHPIVFSLKYSIISSRTGDINKHAQCPCHSWKQSSGKADSYQCWLSSW